MTKKARIVLTLELWNETINGLRMRGNGERETACVWAGHRGESEHKVLEVVFLDDLAGVISRELNHRVTMSAIDILFKYLKDKKLSIVADLHTHPHDWVGLSWVDKEHPLEYRMGFLMIVLPNYACGDVSLDNIGVHEYEGDAKWRELLPSKVKQGIIIKES